jgi:hypothetical protein
VILPEKQKTGINPVTVTGMDRKTAVTISRLHTQVGDGKPLKTLCIFLHSTDMVSAVTNVEERVAILDEDKRIDALGYVFPSGELKTDQTGRIGAGWDNSDGSISIRLDYLVVLPSDPALVITLFPRDKKGFSNQDNSNDK